jgi:hypothetical protein
VVAPGSLCHTVSLNTNHTFAPHKKQLRKPKSCKKYTTCQIVSMILDVIGYAKAPME